MRVAYVSGFAEQALEQAVLYTNDAFLGKPFHLRELATRIQFTFLGKFE